MKTYDWKNLSFLERQRALSRPQNVESESISKQVQEIIGQVRQSGDAAVIAMTKKFDQVDLNTLKVESTQLKKAYDELNPVLKEAIKTAEKNIRLFHVAQRTQEVRLETQPGVTCFIQKHAIKKVGIYIPAGSAPLLSTTLMLAIPAQVAGCSEIILMSPPLKRTGRIDASIMAIAHMLGLQNVYCAGGAQAIAAMAYGTESVPKVHKIFGPGNAFVTEAKQQVSIDPFGACIDIPAGPSEVLVIADKDANPVFVAADLISQAEHDKMSQVLLIATDLVFAKSVQQEVETQLLDLPRRNIAEVALKSSRVLTVDNLTEAFEVSNLYAPEHLILQISEPLKYLNLIDQAGSVFIGAWSPEAVGDYASGTNHVLPTYGFARSMSGVTLDSFLKTISFQELTKEGLLDLGPKVEILASAEDLIGHKRAVSFRLKELKKGLS